MEIINKRKSDSLKKNVSTITTHSRERAAVSQYVRQVCIERRCDNSTTRHMLVNAMANCAYVRGVNPNINRVHAFRWVSVLCGWHLVKPDPN